MATEETETQPPEAVIEGPSPSGAEVFFEEHRTAIIAALLIGVLAVFAYIILGSIREGQAQAAAEAFAGAKTIEDYASVVAEHPGTTAAGNALLIKADLEHEEDKKSESQATLNTFLQSYEDHPRYAQGLLAKGIQAEESGDLEEANRYYQEVIDNADAVDIAPLALIRQADLELGRGEYEKARSVYESVMPRYPGNPYYFKVQQMLNLLNTKAPPPPPAVTSDPVEIKPGAGAAKPAPQSSPPPSPAATKAVAPAQAKEKESKPKSEKPAGDKPKKAAAEKAQPAAGDGDSPAEPGPDAGKKKNGKEKAADEKGGKKNPPAEGKKKDEKKGKGETATEPELPKAFSDPVPLTPQPQE